MTDIFISARRGAGAPAEILYGTVTFKPTLAHSRSTSIVLPAPTTFDLVDGEVVATNVQPTPAPVAGQIEWAYEVTFKDRHSKSYSFLVGVPDSTSQVNFIDLPRYFETKPPLFGQGPQGVPGEAATVAVGTVSGGSTAQVTNSGTSTDAVLNFTLPKGDKGDTGAGVPTGGSALQVIRKNSDNTATEWTTLTKTSVGLSNVDNTSDANKPVSTAQGEAITRATTLDNSSKLVTDPPNSYREGSTTTLARTVDGWPEVLPGITFVQVNTNRSRGNQGGTLQWVTAYASTEVTPLLFRTATSGGAWSDFRTVTELVAGGYVPQQMSTFQNVFVGEGALAKAENLRVRNNNAFGIGALANATRARYNDMFGLNAGYSLDSGISEPDTTFKATRNTGMGSNTQRFNKTGWNNVTMGRNSMQTNVEGTDNVFIGAGSASGHAPVGLDGIIVNQVPTNVYRAVGVGVSTLENTTGADNTAVGYQALMELKTGQGNTAIGAQAMKSLGINTSPTGTQKFFINATVSYVFNATDITVTHSGHPMSVGFLVSIQFPGYELQELYVKASTSTTYTLQVGDYPLPTSSGSATVVWYANDQEDRFHNYNIAIGMNAGLNLLGKPSDPGSISSNTLLGLNAGRNFQDGTPCDYVNNSVALGVNARLSGNNQIQLGTNTATVYAGQAIQIRSDERDKADIRDSVLGLEFVNKLRPVDYRLDHRTEYEIRDAEGELIGRETKDGSKKGKRYHHGLIAQEVEEVIKETGVDFGGFQDHKINGGNDVLSIGYEELIAPLIKAVQELSAEVKALKEAK